MVSVWRPIALALAALASWRLTTTAEAVTVDTEAELRAACTDPRQTEIELDPPLPNPLAERASGGLDSLSARDRPGLTAVHNRRILAWEERANGRPREETEDEQDASGGARGLRALRHAGDG